MRIKCNQQNLLSALQTASKALSSKSPLPILEGVYLSTQDDKLIVKCMNMSLQIQLSIDAEIIKEGTIVLPGKIFIEVVRRLPDKQIEIDVSDNFSATLFCGESNTTLQGMDYSEFPSLPELDGESVTLPQQLVKDMIKKTVFATAHDETKPVLTGALMEIDQNKVLMVALDGYRMAMRKEIMENDLGQHKVILPAKSMIELGKILGDEGEMVVSFWKGYLKFEMDDVSIITRLIEGEFIKYDQIIPKEHTTRVTVNGQTLYASIERASLMAREGNNNLIRISITDKGIEIKSQSEIGNTNEHVLCRKDGGDLEIAFNALYLLDVLRTLDDEEISLNFNTNVSPLVINPIEGDAFSYLILPVRIY